MKLAPLLSVLQLAIAVLAVPIESNSLSSYMLVFQNGERTPTSYIERVKQHIKSLHGRVTYEFSTVLTGFQVEISDAKVGELKALSFNPSTKKQGSPLETFFLEKDSAVAMS